MGQTPNLTKFEQNTEFERRNNLDWVTFGKLSKVFKGTNIPINLKRRTSGGIFGSVDYDWVVADSWTLTRPTVQKLQVTERAMERAMGYHAPRFDQKHRDPGRTSLIDITKVTIIKDFQNRLHL